MVMRSYIHDVVHIRHCFSATVMTNSAYALDTDFAGPLRAVVTFIKVFTFDDSFLSVSCFVNIHNVLKIVLLCTIQSYLCLNIRIVLHNNRRSI